MELLKTMGPSAISAEFHMLGPEGGGELKQLVDMIHFFKFQLESRRDYEMVQAYMQVFLKVSLLLCCCRGCWMISNIVTDSRRGCIKK